MSHLKPLLAACAVSLFGMSVQTQLSAQVVISEINTVARNSGDDQWIEIYNLGPNAVEIGTWSLYVATKTEKKPQNYWWPFPAGTKIASKQFLRIHWGEGIPSKVPNNSIYTGNTIYNFLFGYSYEPMSPTSGAVALLSSKKNTDMNKASVIIDWVSWGSADQKRENLAVAAKKWTKDDFVPAPTNKESIALAYYLNKDQTPSSAFFLDETPTPWEHNHFALAITKVGSSCAKGGANKAELKVEGVPTYGNKDVKFVLTNTRGPAFQERFWILVNTKSGKIDFLGCPVWVNSFSTSIILGPFRTAFGKTELPVPLTNKFTAGLWLDYACIYGSPGSVGYGSTNGLSIFIGL